MIIKHKRCLKTFESYLLELVIAVRINLNKKTSMQTMSFLYDVKKKTFTFYRFVIVNMSSLSCRRFALTLSRSFSQPTSMFSTSRTACAQVSVQTDADGIATVSMNKAPVNSLNTEFIQELTQAVVDTEKIAKVNFHLQKHPDSRASTST